MNNTFVVVKTLITTVIILQFNIVLAQIKLNIEKCFELLENQNEDINKRT